MQRLSLVPLLSRSTVARMTGGKITATGRARSTAGVIVIGDEILKGKTHDTNSNFICKRLNDLGVIVKKISVVGDTVDDISEEIASFSSKFDLVFTTGGIGPTHDDKTYMGLAKAFQDDLHLSNEMVSAIRSVISSKMMKTREESGEITPEVEKFPEAGNSSFVDKLATIPRSSQLLWGENEGKRSEFPVVRVKNVIVFPGVPQFCERSFLDLESDLFPPSQIERPFSAVLFSARHEFSFSDILSEIASKFIDTVDIGSYPVVNNNYFSTKLTIESESVDEGRKALEELSRALYDQLVTYDEQPQVNIVEKLGKFRERLKMEKRDPSFGDKLDSAVKIVEKVVDEYKLEEIALSFNGGKDCTVLLHLLRAAIDKKYGPSCRIFAFHIMDHDQFSEMSQFILDVSKQYGVDVMEYPGTLKEGLALLIQSRPSTIPVLMGSRSSDPRGRFMKSPIEWTDTDWPRVLRVCPILHWTYSDVWRFLRGLCVPYCKLYDEGYTSLGSRAQTKKNEALRVKDKRTGEERYLPAFKLEDDSLERSSRI